MLIDLFHPISNVLEGIRISHTVGKDDAHRAFVVILSDCTESLLSSGIPDLQFHSLSVDILVL